MIKKIIQKKLFQNDLFYEARRKGARKASGRLDKMLRSYSSSQDSENLLYIHIPKCAGTSVAKSLGLEGQGHYTVHFHQLRLSKTEFEARYKFAFVRNPYDRLYSLYRYFSFGGDRLNPDVVKKIQCLFGQKALSFEDFLRVIEHKDLVKTDVFFKEMSDYLCPSDSDEVLVDFVGRFENLSDDYEKIRTERGVGEALLSENKSYKIKSNLKEVYNEFTQSFVLKNYRKDFRVFGYTRELE